MILNEYGRVVYESWKWLEQQYEYIKLYEFIVMPNHIHGIIGITSVGARGNAPNRIKKIGELVGAFKTVATNRVTKGGFPPAPTKLWQRNYYEHIIRDGTDYEQIRNYIVGNPRTWDADKLYQKQLDEFNSQYK